MSEIIYCANGCTRGIPDTDERIPITTDPPSLLCRRCEDNIATWLTEIVERHQLLPEFIEPGSVPKDPDVVVPKRTEAPAPMRLEVIDLLDTRRGRKWLGLIPARDMRGAVGTLHVYAQIIREERNLAPLKGWPTVASETALIQRHRLWAFEQEWAGGPDSLTSELRALHRDLGRAVGIPTPRPVGKCPVIPDDDQDEACEAPLFPSRQGGVYCPRCGTHWNPEQLRILGEALMQDTA